jgi:hypothetical protein
MTTKRIKVKETEEFCMEQLEGKLEDVIAMLQDWKNEGGWEGIEISYGYHGDSDEYYLYKHREETDKEYEKRMKQLEKEKAEKAKAKERKLKQLKKDLASLTDEEKELLGVK